MPTREPDAAGVYFAFFVAERLLEWVADRVGLHLRMGVARRMRVQGGAYDY